jgi:hypothetical protein
VLDQRGQLPRAALGFAGLPRPSYDRALWALRTWLDSWAGIGRIAVGMARQGYDLQLTRYDDRGWRATFYTTGMEHSPTSATGTGWERTPWHATRRGGGVDEDGLINLSPKLELKCRRAYEVFGTLGCLDCGTELTRPRSAKKREPQSAGDTKILPMDLRVGDRLADETGEWEVIAPPYTTAGSSTPESRKSTSPPVGKYGVGTPSSASA